jgi:hypothetical protein
VVFYGIELLPGYQIRVEGQGIGYFQQKSRTPTRMQCNDFDHDNPAKDGVVPFLNLDQIYVLHALKFNTNNIIISSLR